MNGLAAVAGVTLGGLLTDGPGWQWIFLVNVPLAVATAVAAGVASALVTRWGPQRVLLVGLAFAATGLTWLSRLPSDTGCAAGPLPAFVLVGCGLGLSFVPVQVAAFAGVEQRGRGGLAAGLINTSQEAGGALGLAVVTSVLFRRVPELTRSDGGDPELIRAARASVFQGAFLVGAGLLAAAYVIAWLGWSGARRERAAV